MQPAVSGCSGRSPGSCLHRPASATGSQWSLQAAAPPAPPGILPPGTCHSPEGTSPHRGPSEGCMWIRCADLPPGPLSASCQLLT